MYVDDLLESYTMRPNCKIENYGHPVNIHVLMCTKKGAVYKTQFSHTKWCRKICF